MAEPRFYCPDLRAEARCELPADEAHHARKVLRLEPGTELILFDGRGRSARAALLAYEGRRAICETGEIELAAPPDVRIRVAAAIPKGPRADAMVEGLSQAGVDELMVLISKRSVVQPRDRKLERFQRQALESAKQCGRAHLMQVTGLCTLDQAIAAADDDAVRLIAQPGRPRPADLAGRLQRAGQAIVLIGPEGGFTDAELAAAADAGFEPWTLGPHVMRIETAALTAAAVLRYLVEQ